MIVGHVPKEHRTKPRDASLQVVGGLAVSNVVAEIAAVRGAKLRRNRPLVLAGVLIAAWFEDVASDDRLVQAESHLRHSPVATDVERRVVGAELVLGDS